MYTADAARPTAGNVPLPHVDAHEDLTALQQRGLALLEEDRLEEAEALLRPRLALTQGSART